MVDALGGTASIRSSLSDVAVAQQATSASAHSVCASLWKTLDPGYGYVHIWMGSSRPREEVASRPIL